MTYWFSQLPLRGESGMRRGRRPCRCRNPTVLFCYFQYSCGTGPLASVSRCHRAVVLHFTNCGLGEAGKPPRLLQRLGPATQSFVHPRLPSRATCFVRSQDVRIDAKGDWLLRRSSLWAALSALAGRGKFRQIGEDLPQRPHVLDLVFTQWGRLYVLPILRGDVVRSLSFSQDIHSLPVGWPSLN